MNFSPRPFTDTNIYVARAASFVSPSSLRERIARFYRRYVELFSGNLVNAGHARLALRVHYRPIPSICQRLENALNCFLPPSLSLNRCLGARRQRRPPPQQQQHREFSRPIARKGETKARKKRGSKKAASDTGRTREAAHTLQLARISW